jgi:hypothetical protein
MAWVQDGAGPRAVPADTYSPAGQVNSQETVAPYDALAPGAGVRPGWCA